MLRCNLAGLLEDALIVVVRELVGDLPGRVVVPAHKEGLGGS